METLNATLLIKNARQKLEGRDARRMAAFHTGVAIAMALVTTVLQYVLTLTYTVRFLHLYLLHIQRSPRFTCPLSYDTHWKKSA